MRLCVVNGLTARVEPTKQTKLNSVNPAKATPVIASCDAPRGLFCFAFNVFA